VEYDWDNIHPVVDLIKKVVINGLDEANPFIEV